MTRHKRTPGQQFQRDLQRTRQCNGCGGSIILVNAFDLKLAARRMMVLDANSDPSGWVVFDEERQAPFVDDELKVAGLRWRRHVCRGVEQAS